MLINLLTPTSHRGYDNRWHTFKNAQNIFPDAFLADELVGEIQ